MKTFFLLSDLVWVAIVTGGFAVILSLVTLVLAPLLNKIIAGQTVIKHGVDGMSSELAEANRLLGEALGKAKGREELKQEQKEEVKPTEVIVVKPAEVVVIENKNLDK